MNWTAGKKAISLPLVALGITINYQRAVNSFFPINTKGTNQGKKINVTGAPQGSLTITSIYSPDAKGLIEFLKAVSKDIKTASEQITLELHPFGTATNNATGQTINSVNHTLTLTGVEMASLQLSLNGG